MADREKAVSWNGVKLARGNWLAITWGLQMAPRLRRAGLSNGDVMVFLILCGHTDREQRNVAYPSEETIAEESGGSRRQVERAVRDLKRAGFLTTAPRSEGGLLYTLQASAINGAPTPAKKPRRRRGNRQDVGRVPSRCRVGHRQEVGQGTVRMAPEE